MKNNRNKLRIIVALLVVAVIIVGSFLFNGSRMTLTERGVGGPTNWISRIGSTIGGIFNAGANTAGNVRHSKADLQAQIAALEEENRQLQRVVDNEDALKAEAEMLRHKEYNFLPARIVGQEPGNWFQRFTIDLGSASGVEVGQTVVSAVEVENNIVAIGLIGRVVEVGSTWAKVNTLLDEENGAAFLNTRTLDGGIISGVLEGELQGYMYDYQADIIEGDRLYSSGLGGFYQQDLYIGSVKEVESVEGDLVKNIAIDPAVNFNSLYRVYLITGE